MTAEMMKMTIAERFPSVKPSNIRLGKTYAVRWNNSAGWAIKFFHKFRADAVIIETHRDKNRTRERRYAEGYYVDDGKPGEFDRYGKRVGDKPYKKEKIELDALIGLYEEVVEYDEYHGAYSNFR